MANRGKFVGGYSEKSNLLISSTYKWKKVSTDHPAKDPRLNLGHQGDDFPLLLEYFRDSKCMNNFQSIFSRKPVICECFVELKPFQMVDSKPYHASYGWAPLFKLKGTFHEAEVCMFYANLNAKNNTDGDFTSMVYGTPIVVNPDILSVELGVPSVQVGCMAYPMPSLSPKEKGAISAEIGGSGRP